LGGKAFSPREGGSQRIPPSSTICDIRRMPDYRRNRVPGGTYFFAVNLFDRRSDLLVTHITALRANGGRALTA